MRNTIAARPAAGPILKTLIYANFVKVVVTRLAPTWIVRYASRLAGSSVPMTGLGITLTPRLRCDIMDSNNVISPLSGSLLLRGSPWQPLENQIYIFFISNNSSATLLKIV